MCKISYKERVDGTLSCKITTSCPYGVVVYKLSDLSNAHAELPSQSNYSQMVCCTGVPGLSNQCSGNYQTVLKLSSLTNAHVEKNTQDNYPESACLHVPENGIVEVGYKADDCEGYDTTLGSISSVSNSHVGDADAYPVKICATALVAGTISFNISNNSLGFGTLSTENSRFATNDGYGSEDEFAAHTVSASTNGFGGYTIYVQGPTLTNVSEPTETITSIGEFAAPPLAGTEQFGIRVTALGGNGDSVSPYDDPILYAYGADQFTSDDIANDPDNDDVATVYSLYYLANMSGGTTQGDYSTSLTFIIVSNF
jgi:hypothetical protein